MLWCDLQTAAHMPCDELAGIVHCCLVTRLVLAAVQQQVVAHATANIAVLDAWQGIHCAIHLQQFGVIGIQVRTDLWMDTGRTATFLAGVLVLTTHAIHVGRGSTQVTQVTFEVGHLHHLFHLAQDALLRAAGDEFSLVGRDGTEGASAKTATMDVHTELDHVVGGDTFPFVLRVWLTGVGKVERGVELLRGHWREGWVDDHIAAIDTLQQSLGMHHVRLLLDMAEVLSLCPFVTQTFLMAVQHDIVVGDASRNLVLIRQINGLRQVAYITDLLPVGESLCQLDSGLLAHAIGDHVSRRVAQQTFLELV